MCVCVRLYIHALKTLVQIWTFIFTYDGQNSDSQGVYSWNCLYDRG